jgi:hypothetical protein
MPRKGSPYGPRYEAVRAAMLGLPCELRITCDGAPGNSVDHDPPLSRHTHIEGTGCCRLRPACMACQRKQGTRLTNQTRQFRALGIEPPRQDLAPHPPSRRWA